MIDNDLKKKVMKGLDGDVNTYLNKRCYYPDGIEIEIDAVPGKFILLSRVTSYVTVVEKNVRTVVRGHLWWKHRVEQPFEIAREEAAKMSGKLIEYRTRPGGPWVDVWGGTHEVQVREHRTITCNLEKDAGGWMVWATSPASEWTNCMEVL